ncbi:TBC1 domain, member 5 [Homalodisca vitripennis]|nr:TBC1 domain, member 5 [Homalodisca vitripennis]
MTAGQCTRPFTLAETTSPDKEIFSESPVSEVLNQLDWIKEHLLAPLDPELHQHLQQMDVTLALFGIRWLRLLFGREFPLQDLLVLWDAVFAEGNMFQLVNYIVVAMLMAIRHQWKVSQYLKKHYDCQHREEYSLLTDEAREAKVVLLLKKNLTLQYTIFKKKASESYAAVRLQGAGKFVSDMYSFVKAFENKLKLFKMDVKSKNFAHFPACKSLTEELREKGEESPNRRATYTRTAPDTCVGRHTVKELQRSYQPASPHMSAPTPDCRGRTITD